MFTRACAAHVRYMPLLTVAETATSRRTFKKDSVVTGHHIYKSIWTPFIKETLTVEIHVEEGNQYDRYALSVVETGQEIVGDVPRSISKVS